MRLVQIVRHEKESPLSSNLCPILNTLDHLMLVLANWAETSFFLKLALDLSTAASSTTQGMLFTNDYLIFPIIWIISLFNRNEICQKNYFRSYLEMIICKTYNPAEHVNTSTTTSFEIHDNEDIKLGMYKVFEI